MLLNHVGIQNRYYRRLSYLLITQRYLQCGEGVTHILLETRTQFRGACCSGTASQWAASWSPSSSFAVDLMRLSF